MIQGIILCSLGVLTFGLGLKQFWDRKPVDQEQETPAPEKAEPKDVIDVDTAE